MNHDPSTSFSSPSFDPSSSSQPLPSTSSALVSCSHTSSHPDHHLPSPPPKASNILPIDYVLLPTAIIYVRNRIGAFMPCRAILDSASQVSFITSRLVNQLNLNHRRSQTSISGIGQSSMISDKTVHILVQSRDASYRAVVTRSVTDFQPHFNINATSWRIPQNISLADPNGHFILFHFFLEIANV